MGEGNSIISIGDLNLGELGKPATVLIEKISDAVGGILQPYQIKRIAKAEAEAAIIKAKAEIKVTELQRRALTRFLSEEAKKQENMERITEKALPLLGNDSKPENVEDDWIANFFDKCRIVSDEQMQNLWARVLAGEANTPGTFAKRTVNLLASLDKADAELFTALCGFCWMIGGVCAVVYDREAPIYNNKGMNFSVLSHLDDIGLIKFEVITSFLKKGFGQRLRIFYYGQPFDIEFKKLGDNQIDIGYVMLTKAGEQLAQICGARPVDGFVEYVIERWVGEGFSVASPMRQAK